MQLNLSVLEQTKLRNKNAQNTGNWIGLDTRVSRGIERNGDTGISAGPPHEVDPPMQYRYRTTTIDHWRPRHGQIHEYSVLTKKRGIAPEVK